MLLEALLAGFVIAAPGPGRELQRAEEVEGVQQSYYGRDTGDPTDSPLTLRAAESSAVPPPEPDTTVHGVPADFTDLRDDGKVYGRSLRWIEQGVELSVELDGRRDDGALRAIAESVTPVPPARWQALVVATSPAPDRPPPGSKAVVARRSGGATLTALLPPGFPVAPEDERSACFRVRYRGDASTSCENWPSWERLGGAVYVFGAVSPRVKRVRVIAKGVGRVSVPAVRVPGYPLRRFYMARMPTRTCQVDVRDARTGALLDSAVPIMGASKRDQRRCR